MSNRILPIKQSNDNIFQPWVHMNSKKQVQMNFNQIQKESGIQGVKIQNSANRQVPNAAVGPSRVDVKV